MWGWLCIQKNLISLFKLCPKRRVWHSADNHEVRAFVWTKIQILGRIPAVCRHGRIVIPGIQTYLGIIRRVVVVRCGFTFDLRVPGWEVAPTRSVCVSCYTWRVLGCSKLPSFQFILHIIFYSSLATLMPPFYECRCSVPRIITHYEVRMTGVNPLLLIYCVIFYSKRFYFREWMFSFPFIGE